MSARSPNNTSTKDQVPDEDRVHTWGIQRSMSADQAGSPEGVESGRAMRVISDGDLVFPGWFIKVASVSLIPIVAWAWWMSSQLASVVQNVSKISETQVTMVAHVANTDIHQDIHKVSDVQESLLRHVTDPQVHHAAIKILTHQLKDVIKDVDAIKARLDLDVHRRPSSSSITSRD